MVLRTDYAAGDPNHPDVHNATDAAVNAVQAQANITDTNVSALTTTVTSLQSTVTGVQTSIGSLTQIPSWAGARAKPYDPKTSIYNQTATSTLLMRSAISVARNGGRIQIMCMGNDVVAGNGATPGVNDYPIQLREHLAAKGYNIGGTGYVFTNNNTTPDARLSIAGTWSQPAPTSYNWVQTTTNGAQITFTPDIGGTALDIFTTANSGPFTYKIGNGPVTTVTPPGGGSLYMYTIGGQSIPPGTPVVLTTTSTTNTKIIAFNVRDETGGIEVSNCGVAGTSVTDWLPNNLGTPTNLYFTTTFTGVRIVLLSLDSTEALAAGSFTTYQSNYQTLLTSLTGAGSRGIGLVTSPNISPGGGGFPAITQAAWNNFLNAEYNLADTYNIPLADISDRLGTHAAAVSAFLTADAIHLNGNGYSEVADAALTLISGGGGIGDQAPEPLGLSVSTMATLNNTFDTPAEVQAAINAALGAALLNF